MAAREGGGGGGRGGAQDRLARVNEGEHDHQADLERRCSGNEVV